jgi:general secretion pathway protein C
MKRLPLLVSFILFIALCVSLAYWALQLFKPPLRPIAPTPSASAPPVNIEAAATLFGGQQQANTAVASNIELKGIINAGRAADSVAILAANGKPAQALAIGTELLPGLNVKEIHAGYVLLSENGAVKRVELPEKAKDSGTPNPARPATPPVTVAPAALPPAPPTPPALPPAPPTPSAPATPPTPPGLYVRPATPAQNGMSSGASSGSPAGVPAAVPAASGTVPTPASVPGNRSQIVPATR